MPALGHRSSNDYNSCKRAHSVPPAGKITARYEASLPRLTGDSSGKIGARLIETRVPVDVLTLFTTPQQRAFPAVSKLPSGRVKPNRIFADFSRRLKGAPDIFQVWKGTVYRVTTLKYRDPRIIVFGEGTYRNGGRWNAIRSFRAVYGSTSDVVALAESKANAEYANLPYPFREPRLVVAIDVSLQRVADLTQFENLDLLGVSEEELRGEDWRKVQEQGFESITQALGRALFEAKAEGLLARSARVENGINIALFPQNRRSSSKLTVCEAQQLHDWGLED